MTCQLECKKKKILLHFIRSYGPEKGRDLGDIFKAWGRKKEEREGRRVTERRTDSDQKKTGKRIKMEARQMGRKKKTLLRRRRNSAT